MSEPNVLEYRVSNLEAMVVEIKTAVKSIDVSLQVIAKLEAHHADTRSGLDRSFSAIADHESRLRLVESDMPTIRLIRNWVIYGVILCASFTGVAVLIAAKSIGL